ncbi:MAG: S1 family peptidase [Myxococcota bacterium]
MLIALSVLSSLVFATPPEGVPAPPPQHIYGGDDVPSCGWPSVVSVGGGCTGMLVHPSIVMTAAHCIGNDVPSDIGFGESNGGLVSLAATETCRQGPGWTGATAQGQDYAYCKLATPVTNVPIIPVASGCELTAIQPGARIMHVGFGVDEEGGGGRKKMVDIVVNSISPQGELISGNGAQTVCNGDSGGPTFVYLDPAVGGDGSWRVAAIHSWAQGADPVEPNCSGVAGSVLVSQAIDWIEQDSGIDITPCTDGDEWNPTAHCGALPTTPWDASGSYTTECAMAGEVVEFGGVCGDPLDATPDDVPPVVSFASPTPEAELELDGDAAPVEVEIVATDDGWGVDTVELTIHSVGGGSDQVDMRTEFEPWIWNAGFPAGSYELTAVAVDHAGNASEPVTVCFGVGEPGCESLEGGSSSGGEAVDDTAGGDDDGDGTGGTGDGTGGDDAGQDDEASGCGCRNTTAPAPGSLLLLGVALIAIRRRA